MDIHLATQIFIAAQEANSREESTLYHHKEHGFSTNFDKGLFGRIKMWRKGYTLLSKTETLIKLTQAALELFQTPQPTPDVFTKWGAIYKTFANNTVKQTSNLYWRLFQNFSKDLIKTNINSVYDKYPSLFIDPISNSSEQTKPEEIVSQPESISKPSSLSYQQRSFPLKEIKNNRADDDDISDSDDDEISVHDGSNFLYQSSSPTFSSSSEEDNDSEMSHSDLDERSNISSAVSAERVLEKPISDFDHFIEHQKEELRKTGFPRDELIITFLEEDLEKFRGLPNYENAIGNWINELRSGR